MFLHQIVTPLMQSYIESQFGEISITEKTANCDKCICSFDSRKNLPYYRHDLKCCTFYPFLPNYIVGAILVSPQIPVFIKDLIRRKISDREYTLPMGIFVPIPYQLKFINREPQDFGNKEDLLCPYYNKGKNNCGLWQYRGSVCTSYFCYSDYGPQGLEFWEILGEYLHTCEMVLSQDCVVSRGLDPEIIDGQLEYLNCSSGTKEEMDSNSMSEPLFLHYWSGWDEGIEEYYISCYHYINSMSVEELKKLLLEETQGLEMQVKEKIPSDPLLKF